MVDDDDTDDGASSRGFNDDDDNDEHGVESRGELELDPSLLDDHPHLRRPKKKAYREAFREQEELIHGEHAVDYLTRAMKNLVNCKAITVTDEDNVWGLKRVYREIGILPQRCLTFESPESVQIVQHTLNALFTAVAKSGIKIESLEIASGSMVEKANRISPDMLVRPPSAILN